MHELDLSLSQIFLAFSDADMMLSYEEGGPFMVRCSIRDIIVNWYSLAGAIYYTIAIFKLL